MKVKLIYIIKIFTIYGALNIEQQSEKEKEEKLQKGC